MATTHSPAEDLATALDEGIGSAVHALPAEVLASSTGYPVQVTLEPLAEPNKFWATPVVGIVAKVIILIPQLIALAVMMTIAVLMQLVIWIPVMSSGTYPEGAYRFVSGVMRWEVRFWAFFFGLTDTYPPFALREIEGYPVQVAFQPQTYYNRGWAIPVVGLLVKAVLLIPHLIILHVLQIVVGVLFLVTWIPVLFNGKYPEWGYELIGGYLRWSTRVFAYLFGLTDEYAPFRLG